jgi:excisionase family DNA binding protein
MSAYLSARAAAEACGVSEKTIRNWIRSGRLSAERAADGFRIAPEQLEPLRRSSAPHTNGLRAEAPRGDESAENGRGGRPRNDAEGADSAEWASLVRHLTQQNLEMAGRLGFLQAQLQAKDEQIKALEAPEEPAPEPVAPRWPDEPTPADPPRPWWRFW